MKSTPLYSSVLSAAAAGIVLIVFSGCCKRAPTPTEELIAASKAAGIEIRADEVFAISRGTESLVTAPTTAWAQIPATELPKGVTFAFAHFSTIEPKVAPGYYALKAFADDIRVGTVAARVQLLDRAGKVAAEIPAEMEIHSLTVPADSRSSFVTTSTGAAADVQPGNSTAVWYRCSNGQCIRGRIFVARRFF